MPDLNTPRPNLDAVIEAALHTVQQKPGDFFAHFNLGRACEMRGRIPEALIAYQKALRLNTEDEHAWAYLASLQYRMGQIQAARYSWQRLLTLKPSDLHSHLGLARLALREQKFSEAVQRLKRAERVCEPAVQILVLLAKTYAKAGFEVEALDTIRRAVALHPGYYPAHILHAQLALDLQQRQEARRTLQEIQQWEEEPQVLMMLTRIHLENRETSKALEAAQSLIEYEPLHAKAHQYLGQIYIKLGEYQKARKSLQCANRIRPGLQGLPEDFCRLYACAGQWERALNALRGLSPDTDIEVELRIEVLLHSQNAHEALELANHQIEKRHLSSHLFLLQSKALQALSRPEEALESCILCLELEPQHQEALQHAASLLDRLGRADEAMLYLEQLADEPYKKERSESWSPSVEDEPLQDSHREFEKQLSRNGEDLQFLTEAGDQSFASGDIEEALRRWRMALAQEPDALFVLLRISEGLRIRGDYAECITMITELSERWPDELQVWYSLIQALWDSFEAERAMEVLEQALLNLPGAEELLVLGLKMSRSLQDRSRILQFVDRLLEVRELHPLALKARAVVALSENQYQKANQDLQIVLQASHAKDLEAIDLMIGLKEQQEELRGALKWAQQRHERQPDSQTLLRMGGLHRRLNEPLEAEDALRKAMKDEPESNEIPRELGLLLADEGDYAEAISLLEPLCRSEHQEPLLLQQMGWCWLQLGRWKNALFWLDEALRLDPRTPELHWYRGMALENLERTQAAIEAYESCIRLSRGQLQSFAADAVSRLKAALES